MERSLSMSEPIICFGQQPCGIFPKRFLYAKIVTAKRLQKQLGGEIVFFYHDSDHDPRETLTRMVRSDTGAELTINFAFKNKLQKKYSPLYAKEILEDWRLKTVRQLPSWVEPALVDIFRGVEANNVSDFCLEIYQKMGLLEGVKIVRSGDSYWREKAKSIDDCFADVSYEGELVRARIKADKCLLHKGGDAYIEFSKPELSKSQISPTRDERLLWMQSILNCSHYIAGAGEIGYLDTSQTPEITFIKRDAIERSGDAYTSLNHDF